MQFQPSQSLASRTYVGLVLSQFLAAFNDQAIHFVAIFYASDMLVRYARVSLVDQKLVLSIVTLCFISPFFLFSPLAGILADKFSKRAAVVFWKVAEVGITGLALAGFLLLHAGDWGLADSRTLAIASAVILIVCVFLMGTHSAFFVPAKYGIMPEILAPSVLSRGNGLLEGTSFVSQILGTSFGAFLYVRLSSKVDAVTGELHPGQEWLIGVLLFGLALLGVGFSLLVERVPAAAPHLQLTLNPFRPMAANFRELRRNRSLVLATVGIAFFTFMTLFMRQSLLFEGENDKELYHTRTKLAQLEGAPAPPPPDTLPDLEIPAPERASAPSAGLTKEQQAELNIAILVALIGLGVGIGCATAGQISGNRLELGLAPVGAALLIFFTLALAAVTPSRGPTIAALIAVGIAAGLYIVPMYTMLQHRAPKESKGNLVATSNFLNVTGGIVAVVVFYFVTFALQIGLGLNLSAHDVGNSPELARQYIAQLESAVQIPKMLFVFAAAITAIMLFGLCWSRPDFLLRSWSWLRWPKRRSLSVCNVDHLPNQGPLLVVTNCRTFEEWMYLVAAFDRFTRFVEFEPAAEPATAIQRLARASGVAIDGSASPQSAEWRKVIDECRGTLLRGNLLAISLVAPTGRFGPNNSSAAFSEDHSRERPAEEQIEKRATELIRAIQSSGPAVAVYCASHASVADRASVADHACVIVGDQLPANADSEQMQTALCKLQDEARIGARPNFAAAH